MRPRMSMCIWMDPYTAGCHYILNNLIEHRALSINFGIQETFSKSLVLWNLVIFRW